jgi:hypothetical protein
MSVAAAARTIARTMTAIAVTIASGIRCLFSKVGLTVNTRWRRAMDKHTPDYTHTPSTLRVGRRIVGRYANAKAAITAYINTPALFDGHADVAVWIGPSWHCTYLAKGDK